MEPTAGRQNVIFYHTLPSEYLETSISLTWKPVISARQDGQQAMGIGLSPCPLSLSPPPSPVCLHTSASVSMPSGGDHAIFSQLSLSSVIILLGQKNKQVTLVPFGAFSISKNQMGIKRQRFLIKGITQAKLAHANEREHQHYSCLEQQTPQLQGDHSHAERSNPSLWSWA